MVLRPSQQLWSCRDGHLLKANLTFSWASLGYAVNQHSVHILSLVTLHQPKEENDCRKYFMTNLHESMVPDN